MVTTKKTSKVVKSAKSKTEKKPALKSTAKKEDATIILTAEAAKKVKELQKQEKKETYGLKLYVFPGGCSGFQYGLDFEKSPEKTDIVTEQHGVKLFVDKESASMLKGTRIDFVDSLKGSGFKIDNPNVEHSCGCGKSFC